MKTLLLLRHAKSSWDDADLADFDRPLNSRGREAAPLIGSLIYDRKLEVDLILSSPAKRAKQTAILVREAAQFPAKIHYEERIYEASALALLYLLAEQSDEYEKLMLVGHNPGLERLTNILTSEKIAMKTATLVKITLKIGKWHDILPACGHLDYVLCPKKEVDETD